MNTLAPRRLTLFAYDSLLIGSMSPVLEERSPAGQAITPQSMFRILAVQAATGPDRRPTQLELAGLFDGFADDASACGDFTPFS